MFILQNYARIKKNCQYMYFFPVAVKDLKVLIDQLHKNDQIFCDYSINTYNFKTFWKYTLLY